MAMIPLLVARLIIEGAGDEMSDIQFLAIKEFNDKLKTATNEATVTGLLVRLTASAGKDLYLAEAKVTVEGNNITSIESADIELTMNAITIEKVSISDLGNTTSYTFALKGDKVLAGQRIDIQITGISGTPKISGTLIAWEEDTGTTPQEPPLEPV